MNNNQGNNELAIGAMIFAVIAVIMVFAGAIVAVVGVCIYIIYAWRGIYRYEGKSPVLWLAFITALVAMVCISGALETIETMRSAYGGRYGEKSLGYVLLAALWICGIAVPTAIYEIYRAISPVSHIKIGMIESFHELYAQGTITRLERNKALAGLIAMPDDEVERQHAENRRAQQAQPQNQGGGFDVPEQN